MQRPQSIALSAFSLLAAFLILSENVHAAPLCGLVPPTTTAAVVVPTGAPSGLPASANGTAGDVVATGWYAGWLGATQPPSQISWTKYSAVTFAFATTTPDSSQIALDTQSADLLPEFVSAAHDNGVDALLSVGGWTGSLYYSTAVATADNRTAFVKAVVGLVTQYGLDGIDFDWEYPNHQGIGCNTIAPDDSANFLLFLQQLRQDPVAANITLTAAVGQTPFAGPDGTPTADVSAFATVLNHIAVMNYDVWGSWSPTVGPNAPLDDSCSPVQAGSATSALKAWTGAGFPAAQIVLGVPAYGHSFFVDNSVAFNGTNNLALYPPFVASKQPLGDSDVPGAGNSTDQCGNSVGPGGTFDFYSLITAGFLNSTGQAAPGIDYVFDTCSQTPFVYNSTSEVMISFDDATSFAAKGKFIADNDMAGFAVWHVGGDSGDILLDAISGSMGLEQICS
ncbi:glycoside hydrolase family 18 protein [Hypholoma sublateritium FD-334 SS-4]|uniref:Glycoside hydrolase family 18 protein n=1 Tax=Hypholoma sublateritium (strain FD-334 SS-4) TaxID=945553 RepID=A0A0D2KVT8_HYPSF|nr:glycoside hydrolase family 18 protein [Hypholoma sublateritium FD-334 SS-4]